MSVKLLTEHLLEVLSLKGGCTDSSESTLVKMSNCLKSHRDSIIDTQSFLKNTQSIEKLVSNTQLQAYTYHKDIF